MSMFEKWLLVTAKAAGGEKMQSAHVCDISLRARILGREVGPSEVSPNQRSRWKHAFSLLKHV